jgi:hypothetical protein
MWISDAPGVPDSTSRMIIGVSALRNRPKLTLRRVKAITASGNIARLTVSGVWRTRLSAEAMRPPSTVPPMRSSIRCQVRLKCGCIVISKVMTSQRSYSCS